MSISSDVIGNGLFALTAAISAIAYQYWQYRRQLSRTMKGNIADDKKRIIEALISYRFALLPNRTANSIEATNFNAALSAIPVHFSHCKDCMDSYRSFGDSFNSDKYFKLIISLMKDVPIDYSSIDKHLLENVPHVSIDKR